MSQQIVTEAKIFFQNLIKTTGTYFLSDYVEDVRDYVGETEANDLCLKRDALRSLCNEHGIDFHNISCQVASEFMKSEDNNERICDVTGEKMSEGWVVNDFINGELYFKYEKDAKAWCIENGYADLQQAYYEDVIYWTEW